MVINALASKYDAQDLTNLPKSDKWLKHLTLEKKTKEKTEILISTTNLR